MELQVNRSQFDLLFNAVARIYVQAELEINNYKVRGRYIYFVPNEELTPREVLLLSKQGVIVNGFAVFLKVQNANLTNVLPNTLSFYEFNGVGTTWGDMDVVVTGTTHSLLKIEPYTNNISMLDLNVLVNLSDVEEVFANRGLNVELSRSEYPNPNGVLTYDYINTFYNRGVWFDFVDAFIEIRKLFQAEVGVDDAAKLATLFAASPDDARIVCRWDLVDDVAKKTVVTNRLIATANMDWFNTEMRSALESRLFQWKSWYQTLLASNKQVNVFKPDYRAEVGFNGEEYYLQNYNRYPFFGRSDFEVINFNDFINASVNYQDLNFGYDLTKLQVTTDAKKILENRQYYVV